MFRVILWDIDGTLLDFEKAEEAGIRGCFEKFNLGECTEEMLDVYKKINRRYWLMLERGEIEKPVLLVQRFEDFLDAYGIGSSVAAEFNAEYQLRLGDTVVFCEHALETVLELQGKVLQCAVTNGTKVAQDRKLKNSGLDKELDHIFISEEVGVEKPNKAFFDTVFAKIGSVAPEEVLIVGDSLTSDIQGGINVGIKTCWFNPKGLENTSGLEPDYEIRDIGEVLKLTNLQE
ncbi:MAG: YjjG family noncanonical pyrimidine nucleotidase [Lachnospiraceae bacterium]|nr:YjjG family noncanonical pyrimidine nucleotidase [Lachnospiraceae bacterium]